MRILAALVGLALASTIACAQGLSKRPVRVLAPVAPGGPTDTVIRLLVPKLSEALGQTLVVDNRLSNNGVAATA